MDGRILKALLLSCESVTKDIENSEDYQKLLREDKFSPKSNDVLNALCSSLTNLLSYKVSKEAYQRYAVRLHVIEALRDWCRIATPFDASRVLTDKNQSSRFIENILEKHLTNDVLDSCNSDSILITLTGALMCLKSTNPFCKRHIEKLLLKLSRLETSDEIEQLLCYAVRENSDLDLQLSTLESIYDSQRCKLIEEPLLDNFVSTCTDLNKDKNAYSSGSLHLFDQLFEFAGKSPTIFWFVCAFLKELFIELDYAPAALNFVQSTLKRVKERCNDQDKNIVDLYPRDLQSHVILLQIDPSYHTHVSKAATIQILETIFIKNRDIAIILFSHFPAWFKVFGE